MIWGDSITEETFYPRYVEMYLLACAGRQDIRVFTTGHSGEALDALVSRQIDLKAFNPTLVTFNYGMNDTQYSPYTSAKGTSFDQTMQAGLAALSANNVTQRVVAGPPPVDNTFDENNQAGFWQGTNTGGLTAAQGQNVNLSNFSSFGHTEAVNSNSADADIYDRMMDTYVAAEQVLGTNYAFSVDGVHPAANGHLMITYEILKALTCSGNIASINVNMGANGAATASSGQTIVSYSNGAVVLDSAQYPFCYNYDPTQYQGASGLASILPYLPFSQDLNRFVLTVTNLGASSANVSWGSQTMTFTSAQLAAGVNLAAQFTQTPFDATFAEVEAEILSKQEFEDFEIKGTSNYFGNDNGGNVDNNMIAVQSQYDAAVKALIVPVRNTIVIVPAGTSSAVAPVITGTMMGYPTVGQSFTYQLSALNSPTSYTATNLPSGLTFNNGTGQISGIPAAAGTSVIPVTATNSHGTSSTHLTLTVGTPIPNYPSITSPTTASATVGVLFTYQISATNNPSNYFVTVASNQGTEPPQSSLPPGLTYNTASGLFSGTPTAAGTYTVQVAALNAAGVSAMFVTLTINSGSNGTAPLAPTNLLGTASISQVALSWTASAGAATYNVYRGTSPGAESASPVATGVTSASYTDSGLANGTTYYYTVTAVNSSGTSGYSNEASATPTTTGGVPPAPTGLSATPGNGQVVLSWTASAGASSYNIFRGNSAGGESSVASPSGVTTTSYTVTGLANGKTYYFRISAVNSSGSSGYSNEASTAPSSTPLPSAPTGLTATPGNAQVSLHWTGGSGATSYNVYRGTTAGGESTMPVASGITELGYIDVGTGLVNGTTYYYRIVAVNATGDSGYSNEVSAMPSASTSTSIDATDTPLLPSWAYLVLLVGIFVSGCLGVSRRHG